MSFLWLSFLLLNRLALSRSLTNLSQSIPPRPRPGNPPTNLPVPALRLPRTNLTIPNIVCSGDDHRRDLEFPSCSDALFQIPDGARLLRFANRKSEIQYDVPLPFRWISSDGVCILDIKKLTNVAVGSASWDDIYAAAYRLVHECVMGDEVGGLATNIGPAQNMALRITSYRPRVLCSDVAGPPPASCETIIDTMPATQEGGKVVFGKAGDPGVEFELPFKLTELLGKCQATITSPRGPSDTAFWYEMWESVVAVYGMCVRRGRTGHAFKRGTRGYLSIDITAGESSEGMITSS